MLAAKVLFVASAALNRLEAEVLASTVESAAHHEPGELTKE